jgi:alpha-glucosidase (family GH31 glycosyl hydrolase)
MPQREEVPSTWTTSSKHKSHVSLEAKCRNGQAHFTFEAVQDGIFRTRFWSSKHPLPPCPNVEHLSSSVEPDFDAVNNSTKIIVNGVEATVNFRGAPVVSLRFKDQANPIHADIPDRSYVLDGEGCAHYMVHDRKALHVGLGEKAAPMDLTARPFILSATDCFGYDAHKTDPMYKHIPLLIKTTPQGVVGVFSTSHTRGFWSVGSEIDGLWGHFKVFRQDYGGLEEYLLIGRTLRDVMRLYGQVAGFPLLSPRWVFGYISGGYRYCAKDDPPSHVVLDDFARKLVEHDIPCSAHQMSSGYSIADTEPKVRNVFTWNKHRFPDPEGFLKRFHRQGIRLLTNIKPFILSSHPDFEYLKSKNALFTDPSTGKMGTMKLWSAGGGESGLGGHIDFTNKAAFAWWVKGVANLKQQGVDGMWNDNNEYTLPDDDWTMSLDNLEHLPSPTTSEPRPTNLVGLYGRALHCELMAKASALGLESVAPNERPFVLTRSGTPGTFRHAASSWSGDNMTSWSAMRASVAISLNAGLSGMHNFGHDIGGFEGTQPSPELLLRWIQLGIHQPRFAINCFKTSPQDNQAGEVIEPWMYPDILPQVRAAIKRRYELMPYLYSLSLEGHLTGAPPVRWVGWDHEGDPEVWASQTLKNGEEQFWLGDSLLVGCATAPGQQEARMYLPRRTDEGFDYGYVDTNASPGPEQYLASGQWVTIPVGPWRTTAIPVLACVGGAVITGTNVQTKIPGEPSTAMAYCEALAEDDERAVEVFPPMLSSHGHTFKNVFYDDDGYGHGDRHRIGKFELRYSAGPESVTVGLHILENREVIEGLPWWRRGTLQVIMPWGDDRFLVAEDGTPLVDEGTHTCGRRRWTMSLSSDARPRTQPHDATPMPNGTSDGVQ